MGKKRKKRCLAFLMALAMMTGLFMGDAAGLLVKAEDTPASVKIGITTLETGWYVKAVDPPSTPGPAATIRGVDKVGEEPESGGYIYFDKDTATMTVYNDMEIAASGLQPVTVTDGNLTISGREILLLQEPIVRHLTYLEPVQPFSQGILPEILR